MPIYAKAAARYPAKNFKDVIPVEVGKDTFDYLLLQAGSVDISNLNTKDKPEEHSDYFKREVRCAAKNLFVAAESAFVAQPSLKKVVIMYQTPRYDPRSSDPLALKPVLADLFNQTLGESWLGSNLKDKIVIGVHNMECTGGIKEARYRDTKNNKYDGVHLFGPSGKKTYTISVLDILLGAGIADHRNGQIISGQDYYSQYSHFQYQKKKNVRINRDRVIRPQRNQYRANDYSSNYNDVRTMSNQQQQNRYTVPTSNIFDHLNW